MNDKKVIKIYVNLKFISAFLAGIALALSIPDFNYYSVVLIIISILLLIFAAIKYSKQVEKIVNSLN